CSVPHPSVLAFSTIRCSGYSLHGELMLMPFAKLNVYLSLSFLLILSGVFVRAQDRLTLSQTSFDLGTWPYQEASTPQTLLISTDGPTYSIESLKLQSGRDFSVVSNRPLPHSIHEQEVFVVKLLLK